MTDPDGFCTCTNNGPGWCVQCGGDFRCWPAALAERLERLVREKIDEEDPNNMTDCSESHYRDVLRDVDAARARGEIPGRKEMP